MIFKRRPLYIAACVFAILSVSPVTIGIDITIDYDEYLVSPYIYDVSSHLSTPPLMLCGLTEIG